jgi:uncharacterized protein (TIGR02270 family)
VANSHIILDQHCEEASFNWFLRNLAVNSSNYTIVDLVKLDERVIANLDGLLIAGDQGWDACYRAAQIKEPGEIFTSAYIAFQAGDLEKIENIFCTIEFDIELQKALIAALGWIAFRRIKDFIQELLNSEIALHRFIGISAFAIHRKDPGPTITQIVNDRDPKVRARALKAVGELSIIEQVQNTFAQINDKDEKCSFYARWSNALLSNTLSDDNFYGLIVQKSSFAVNAADLLFRKVGISHANQLIRNFSGNTEKHRITIDAYKALGDPQSIPILIDFMSVDKHARAAGEAFSFITGLDIAYEDLETDMPAGFEAGPTDDPEDENVEMDPDEDLPWPDAELIQRWWHANKRPL